MSVQCGTLLCSCLTFNEMKGTSRTIMKEIPREAVREWILSKKSRFEHDNQGQSCSSPSGGKKKVLKKCFGVLHSAGWKSKTEGPPPREWWSQELSREQQWLLPWFSITAPHLHPSPGGLGHSALWGPLWASSSSPAPFIPLVFGIWCFCEVEPKPVT